VNQNKSFFFLNSFSQEFITAMKNWVTQFVYYRFLFCDYLEAYKTSFGHTTILWNDSHLRWSKR
jgi:hypothetical protein